MSSPSGHPRHGQPSPVDLRDLGNPSRDEMLPPGAMAPQFGRPPASSPPVLPPKVPMINGYDHRLYSQTPDAGSGGSVKRRPLPQPSPPAQNSFPPSSSRRALPTPPAISGPRQPRALPTLPTNTSHPPSAPARPLPSTDTHGQMGSAPRVGASHDSLTSMSGPSAYFSGDTPSRSTSQSYSISTISSIPTLEPFGTSRGSHYESQETSRSPSSLDHAWDIRKPPDNEGTTLTLRPDFLTGPAELDGCGTPTPRDWLAAEDPGFRSRLTSSSTLGAIDAGLPPTPKVAPSTSLPRTRSFYDESERVQFPVPRTLGESSRAAQASHCDSPPHDRQYTFHRHMSDASSHLDSERRRSNLSPSWAQQSQQPAHWVERKLQIHHRHRGEFDDESEQDIESEWDEEEAEVNEIRFFQPAFLSETALQLRYRVERRRHLKAGIAWVGSFTGRDIVTTIQGFLPSYTRETMSDRRLALIMARSLQNQLWFVEVDWDIKPLRDSSDDVFRFMGEMEALGGDSSELPKGLMTMATRCYSPSCSGDGRCYAPRCPYKTPASSIMQAGRDATPLQTPATRQGDWTDDLDPMLLREISPEQKTRQTVIRQAIQSEIQYEADLTAMEKLFIDVLRETEVIRPQKRLEAFILDVFSNALELREACKRMIDSFSIRQREQAPLIGTVGDIFLEAATDFRLMYPEYTGNLPNAESLLKRELDDNPDFRLFCERIVRENDRRMDIRHLITRPSAQLQRYPAVIEAILNATDPSDPDIDFLSAALHSIQSLSAISQLKLFQASKGRGPAGKLQWYDLVPEDQRNLLDKKEQKRQMQIWELIQGEMEYVADLETMDTLFVDGLREADVPIIERSRLEIFLDDAFHNYRSLLEVHSELLERLQSRQQEQHPEFGIVSDLIMDAALNWREAYMEYVTHYPIAKAKVQEEQTRNPRFAKFLETCLKNPSANRQDIYHFINRPIPRLLRYNLLLNDILKSSTGPEVDNIPQVIELIGDLGKATQKGVAVNEAKVDLWQFQNSLDGGKFGTRSIKDLDLLNPMRELIHKGRVFRQPEGTISGSWVELVVLLFDNYFVLVKAEKISKSSRKEERQVRFFVNRRPIPLELLSLGNFSEAPKARTGKLFGHAEADQESESRTVWPFSISFIGQGQLGGQYTLWTDSYAARADWQEKLQHAKVLRTEVNDAGKVFEMTPLSVDTFYIPPNYAPLTESHTGRVTCSAPFLTLDGRALVAVGCEEGVWIGLRHDPKSLRKVLHVKAVTNVAILEEFGIFLVLQDKSLLAYHLEALVPSASSPQVRAAPQRLSPGKDIVFFTVGQLSGRTLVLYMKKKGMDSLFRVLEPILGRSDDRRRPFGSFLGQRTEWFRLYKDFFIPTEALNVHFLKHKLAVVCAKGFEIMDLTDLKGGSIPIFDPAKVRDRPILADLQRRCDTAKPLGMFRSTETEFLLCYDSFGIYVDRHGEPNRDAQAIEWEGRPESVAFHPPYLLLVSAPFVEIRHIDNAKLLQIFTGSDIHLTWDGTGGQARPFVDNPGPSGYGDETSSQEPRIHICQRPEDIKRRGTQGIGQHVYELTPTLLLNNPLLNPVHTHDSNYFPPAPPMDHRASSIISSDLYQYRAGSDREPSWNGQ